MNRVEILNILGSNVKFAEKDNQSAIDIFIESEQIDVIVTIPYSVTELFFSATDKAGKSLVVDNFECYGELQDEDFIECLMDIHDIIKSPTLRLSEAGNAIEAKGFQWYYWFGVMNC